MTWREPLCQQTKNSGLDVVAAGWQGAIKVHITRCDGQDHYTIDLTPWQNSGGKYTRIAEGILDANQAPDALDTLTSSLSDLKARMSNANQEQ